MRQADKAGSDFAAIESDLQFVMGQLARIPTRKEQARNTLGIIFATATLTTLAVLWFTGYWRYCAIRVYPGSRSLVDPATECLPGQYGVNLSGLG